MKRIIALLVLAGVLLLPGAGLAAESSTCEAYNPQTCTVPTGSGTLRTLPFTGLDATLLVVGGGALLGAGFVIRRISRRLD